MSPERGRGHCARIPDPCTTATQGPVCPRARDRPFESGSGDGWHLGCREGHAGRSLIQSDPSRADRHIQERNTSMMRTSVVALALSAGVILSGSTLADSPKFDGTWSVSLVANGGLCGSGTSSTLMVQNGNVRAGGPGVSVSGQVGPSGSVSLALQKSGVQGTAPSSCRVRPAHQGRGRFRLGCT